MTDAEFPPLTAQELADLNALNIGDTFPRWAGGISLDAASRLVPRMMATINAQARDAAQMRAILQEVLVWLRSNERGQNYWKRMEDAITPTEGSAG